MVMSVELRAADALTSFARSSAVRARPRSAITGFSTTGVVVSPT
jgi:hypothetical protein